MTWITAFPFVATFIAAFNAAIWSSAGWPNLFLKMAFVVVAVWGAIVCASILA